MHEDFETEGFIPPASERVFPTFLSGGRYPADRGKAGLLQNDAVSSALRRLVLARDQLKWDR